jgi:hypothetical protein
MCLKGELGNPSTSLRTGLGEPKCFLVKDKVNGVPPERKTPDVESSLNISNEPCKTGYEKNRASKVSGEDSEERTNLRRAFGSLS